MPFSITVWKDLTATYERIVVEVEDQNRRIPTMNLDMYEIKMLRDQFHKIIMKHAERYFEYPKDKDRKAELEKFKELPKVNEK